MTDSMMDGSVSKVLSTLYELATRCVPVVAAVAGMGALTLAADHLVERSAPATDSQAAESVTQTSRQSDGAGIYCGSGTLESPKSGAPSSSNRPVYHSADGPDQWRSKEWMRSTWLELEARAQCVKRSGVQYVDELWKGDFAAQSERLTALERRLAENSCSLADGFKVIEGLQAWTNASNDFHTDFCNQRRGFEPTIKDHKRIWRSFKHGNFLNTVARQDLLRSAECCQHPGRVSWSERGLAGVKYG